MKTYVEPGSGKFIYHYFNACFSTICGYKQKKIRLFDADLCNIGL